jgi:hypothetical protein
VKTTKLSPFKGAVDSPASAKKFLRWAAKAVGIDFHPDTSFNEYKEGGKKIFSPKEVDHYNGLVADCLVWLEDPCEYLLGLPAFKD